MSDLMSDLVVQATPNRSAMTPTQESSWVRATCRNCGPTTMLAIARAYDTGAVPAPPLFAFLRCAGCRQGFVAQDGKVHPGPSAACPVDGLPAELAAAWDEVRETVSVAA